MFQSLLNNSKKKKNSFIKQEILKLHSLVRRESAYWKWSKTYVVNQGESISEYTISNAKNVPDFVKLWDRTEVFTREKRT